MIPETDANLAELAAELRGVKIRLAALLAERCPGHHAYVQHRDMRPPWCLACRRTADGERVR